MSRGFSLIELLIVIVILGLLAAVSVPWFGKIRRRAELRSAAMEIGTTLVAARMKAVKRNVNASVSLRTSTLMGGTHEIDTIEAPGADSGADPGAQPPASPLDAGDPLRRDSVRRLDHLRRDGAPRRSPLADARTIVIEGPSARIGPINQITIETYAGGRVRIVTPVDLAMRGIRRAPEPPHGATRV